MQEIELLLTNQENLENKQCFKEMSSRNANVWQMAFNASLQSSETKHQNDPFILKRFFKTTFLMIRKNWGHSHHFRDIVELVADCEAKEIFLHLLTAPKNAKYLSSLYVSKCIETMSNYMKCYWIICEVIYNLFIQTRQAK